jgi:uncharacterized protein (TIGR00725 family)
VKAALGRRPMVAVIGSGSEAHEELAEPVGVLVARTGAHLVTGGGGGVMAAVARAFASVPDREGLSMGVLPAAEGDMRRDLPREGYPNAWVEVPIRTHLARSGTGGISPGSRNPIIVLTATAVVALPGGDGTTSEMVLALRYRRPLIAFAHAEVRWPGLPAEVTRTSDLDEVANFLRAVVGPLR